MKKIIVALLCVAQMSCFGMEEKNNQPRFRDIPRFLSSIADSQKRQADTQERQADAAELQAVSIAWDACRKCHGSGYSECVALKKQYSELIIKHQNNS